MNTGFSLVEIVVLFLIFSFLGWLLEVVYNTLVEGVFLNRGMLAGPYCPIYGFGGVLIIELLYPLKSSFWLLFLGCILVCSVVEWLVGWILDKIFHQQWWDYSDRPFNISGYICLSFSIGWGIGGTILMRDLFPPIEFLIQRIPRLGLFIIAGLGVAAIGLDALVTFKAMLQINNKLEGLVEAREKLRSLSEGIGSNVANRTIKLENATERLIRRPELDYKLKEIKKKLSASERRILKAFPRIRMTKSKVHREVFEQFRDYMNEKYRK